MQKLEQDEKNQNKCPYCGQIVGCDAQGRTRKCGCQKHPQTMREYIERAYKARMS